MPGYEFGADWGPLARSAFVQVIVSLVSLFIKAVFSILALLFLVILIPSIQLVRLCFLMVSLDWDGIISSCFWVLVLAVVVIAVRYYAPGFFDEAVRYYVPGFFDKVVRLVSWGVSAFTFNESDPDDDDSETSSQAFSGDPLRDQVGVDIPFQLPIPRHLERRDPPQSRDELIAQGRLAMVRLLGGVESAPVTWEHIISIARMNIFNHDYTDNDQGLGYLNELCPGQQMNRSVEVMLYFGEGGQVGARIAPRIIVIDDVIRNLRNPNQPHVSSTLVGIYIRVVGDPTTLRRIFVSQIVNENTMGYLQDYGPGRHRFTNGSPEFLAVMGTRIGRLVGFVVIDAFPAGRRFISTIFLLVVDGTHNLRFEVGVR
ncbi:hypothetical protein N7456_006453 [Penicillium angulare]|uniref:Uncharacterized protein n=1 Tax=Penicillium angulare TaxID=116970 RepID=A0A9W9FHS9_9EURO|nr:hypothetical protein N7456_006453 [Penicillium angulare]